MAEIQYEKVGSIIYGQSCGHILLRVERLVSLKFAGNTVSWKQHSRAKPGGMSVVERCCLSGNRSWTDRRRFKIWFGLTIVFLDYIRKLASVIFEADPRLRKEEGMQE